MTSIISLMFSARQKADAERIVVEAYKVFCQAVDNHENISKTYYAMRVEVARMAERN